MPHVPMDKNAALRARSFNHLVSGLGRSAKNIGASLKGGSAEEVARNTMYGRHGSSSMVADLGKWMANKASGKHQLGDRIGRGISNVQRPIADFDIRMGNKAFDRLSRSKNNKVRGLRNAFINKHEVPLSSSRAGQADQLLQVDVPGISNPVMKAKDKVIPLAGSMYLTSKIYGDDDDEQDLQSGGGQAMKQSDTEYRDYLIEKISNALSIHNEDPGDGHPPSEEDSQAILFKKASAALKFSAKKQKELEEDNVKLAEENRKLRDEYEKTLRRQEAEKVASVMNAKGVLRKSDIDLKTEELLDLDKHAFDLFKEAVENLPSGEKTASDTDNAVDSLTFLSGSSTLNERKTLADSLDDV